MVCLWSMYWSIVRCLKKWHLINENATSASQFFPDIEVFVKQLNKMNFYMLTTPQNNYTMTQHCHHNTAIQQYYDTTTQQYNNTTIQWHNDTMTQCHNDTMTDPNMVFMYCVVVGCLKKKNIPSRTPPTNGMPLSLCAIFRIKLLVSCLKKKNSQSKTPPTMG